MISEKHWYRVAADGNGVHIELFKIGDDTKVKRFYQIGNLKRIMEHMNSLSEVICNDFMKSAEKV